MDLKSSISGTRPFFNPFMSTSAKAIGEHFIARAKAGGIEKSDSHSDRRDRYETTHVEVFLNRKTGLAALHAYSSKDKKFNPENYRVTFYSLDTNWRKYKRDENFVNDWLPGETATYADAYQLKQNALYDFQKFSLGGNIVDDYEKHLERYKVKFQSERPNWDKSKINVEASNMAVRLLDDASVIEESTDTMLDFPEIEHVTLNY